MKLNILALGFATAASAADLRFWFGGNCVGGFIECRAIAPNTCCPFNYDFRDTPAYDVGIRNTGQGNIVYGWQGTRDGNSCGAFLNSKSTGNSDRVCLRSGSSNAYAGISWNYPSKKRDAVGDAPECTSSVAPDTLVLVDGRAFDLTKADEEATKQLMTAVYTGQTAEDLDESALAFEKEHEGVASRLKMMK